MTKNDEAIYQRLVTKMFSEQIGSMVEVYSDNLLSRVSKAAEHLKHLKEAFDVLWKYNMKLNPA